MKIKFLKALSGDCIHLSFKDEGINRNILIDGGMAATYSSSKSKKGKPEIGELKILIDQLKETGERIDLLILTHVDDDHIGGLLRWFEKENDAIELITQIWFNSGRLIKKHFEQESTEENDNSIKLRIDNGKETSISQGATFEDIIEAKNGLWLKELIKSFDKLSIFGAEFTILSPDESRLKLLLKKWEKDDPNSLETSSTKNDYNVSIEDHIKNDNSDEEDVAIHNGSSISFILKIEGKEMLFLADSHPSIVVSSLNQLGFNEGNRLKIEFVKLSHHGSVFNNSKALLNVLNTTKYVISTNGDKHSHPHKKLISRLINISPTSELYFNYPELIDKIFSKEDLESYPTAILRPTDELILK